jgi:hypothetical protein
MKMPPKPVVATAIITLPRNMRNELTTLIAPVRAKLPQSSLNEEHAAVPNESPQMLVHTSAFLLILSRQHCEAARQQWIRQKTARCRRFGAPPFACVHLVSMYFTTARMNSTTAMMNAASATVPRWKRQVRQQLSVIDVERPTERHVAGYARYLADTKRTTMSTVHTSLASIADHLRLIITPEYSPCRGPLLKQMLRVLVPMAAPVQQTKEVTWPQLQSIAELASASGDAIAQRDSCMIMLAYHTFLRISEVARMDREDITFTTERVNGAPTLIMRVHVNRMAKNDHKRVGHERLVAERAPNVKFCMVRQVQAYLAASAPAPKGPQNSPPTFWDSPTLG